MRKVAKALAKSSNVIDTMEFVESARALMLAGVPVDPVSAMRQQNDAPKPAAEVFVYSPLVRLCGQCYRDL